MIDQHEPPKTVAIMIDHGHHFAWDVLFFDIFSQQSDVLTSFHTLKDDINLFKDEIILLSMTCFTVPDKAADILQDFVKTINNYFKLENYITSIDIDKHLYCFKRATVFYP